MQFVVALKNGLASYIADAPIPDTFGGWFALSNVVVLVKDWLYLAPLAGSFAGVAWLLYDRFAPSAIERRAATAHVNQRIKKNTDKIVDLLDMEDLGDKTCFCRCWKSKKFPYCDGSHNKFNELSGDNVGPLIVKKKEN